MVEKRGYTSGDFTPTLNSAIAQCVICPHIWPNIVEIEFFCRNFSIHFTRGLEVEKCRFLRSICLKNRDHRKTVYSQICVTNARMLKADFLRVAHLVTLSTIKTKTEHATEKRRVVNKFLTYEVVNNCPNHPHFSISKPLC